MSADYLSGLNRSTQEETGEDRISSIAFTRPFTEKLSSFLDKMKDYGRDESGEGAAIVGLLGGAILGAVFYASVGFGAEIIAPSSMLKEIENSFSLRDMAICMGIGGFVGALVLASLDASFNGDGR